MTLEQFINEYRDVIDKVIYDTVQNHKINIDDEEREQWVLNDEGLYNMAQDCGVEEL